ncbi:HAD-IA family hydrolase [Rhodococcus pyridinivorans]|uniref:HAD-IA family hydrolase n=1 Tax=Rhodococcus pyridinivorans TaxID=103816 RepID=UPI002078F345|nr:HAD-IA family hydrolase [Rhodococcus pyridinivorans]USI90174.1 HAD-IA family hydrolase [Rhodococcus pyridinivorans]
MSTFRRPEVVVFDVVGTLASLEVIEDRLAEIGQPREMLAGWFARLLRDGMALTLTGVYRPFLEVATSALQAHTHGAVTAEQARHVMGGFAETTARPDAAAAVSAASEAGFRVFTLSNGSIDSTRSFLERADLVAAVEQVLSIDEVQAWKPASAPYQHAAAVAGLAPEQLALVAVHSWDVHGAHRAGLGTGWSSSVETVPTEAFVEADVTAPSLDGVVRALHELPTRR